jgi:hypothetical protein
LWEQKMEQIMILGFVSSDIRRKDMPLKQFYVCKII